jgi:transposase
VATRDEHAREIAEAMAGVPAALARRDKAISDALKSGMSVRDVAAISGMSTNSIQKIGHDNGWPTPAMKKKWAAEKAERARWRAMVEEFRASRPDYDE